MSEVNIKQMQESISKFGYEFEKILGFGSTSSVSLCKSKHGQQEFAIKRGSKQTSMDEYNTLLSLNHPNIVSLYNSFEDEDSQYLVMEYCSNGTIKGKGKLSTEKFIHYAKQMLDALAYCHSNNVSHRDIRPSNIFIDQHDNIKIGDFTTAKQLDHIRKLREKCTSLIFAAPEILQHKKYCPFKADIWALGITFYYMAVGTYPFKKKDIEDIRRAILFGELDFGTHKIDHQVRFLINKMVNKNPEARLTAEKLLKLPVFQSSKPVKNNFLAASRRNSLNIGLGSSANFFLTKSSNTFEKSDSDDSNNEEDKNTIPLMDVHCFRSVAFHPSSHQFCQLHLTARP